MLQAHQQGEDLVDDGAAIEEPLAIQLAKVHHAEPKGQRRALEMSAHA